ncbi:uncharacterized protein [Haliotis asinina]|uniref:uncharacterized protein n=1 Tax=Haliotis asinina TaxID=109174 RepID=UPI003531EEBF
MACRSWLLVVGSCCLIIVAQVITATTTTKTTITTTSPSPSPSPTSTIPSANSLGSQGTTQEPTAPGEKRLTNQSSTTQTTTSPPTTAQTTTLNGTSSTVSAAAASVIKSSAPTTAAASPTTAAASPATPTTAAASPTTPTTPTTSQNSTDVNSSTSGSTMFSTNTEVTPESSSSTNESSVTAAEATTPSTMGSTVSQGSTTAESTASPSATTVSQATSTILPQTPSVLINEFSYNDLFSNGRTFNVEIRRVDGEAAPKMVVLVSDVKMNCITVIQIDSAAWNDNLAYKKATLTPANRRSVIVSLYTSVNWTSCSDVIVADAVPVDATIVSQDPVTTMTTSIPFVPDYLSRILIAAVNKSSTGQADVSVVRCEDTHLDPGSFIIAPSTFNQSNKCDLDPAPTLKTITLNYTACNTWKNTTTRKLINYFVEKVGKKFQCGFSPVYVQNAAINCTKTTTIQWYIAGKFETQYDNIVNDTTCMDNVTLGQLCLVSACHNCIIAKKISPKNGNISVTVGVVIACIVIFLIIVAIVILYIRKKRRGILQFRMTRLDDDDDDLIMSNDTDDFVGGGQEASFSNSSYTRFK